MFRQRAINRHENNSLCTSRLFDNSTFYKSFMRDITSSKHSVYIESPFITIRRMSQLLPILAKARSKGVHITINTRCPNEHEGKYANQASCAVLRLQEMGIDVLYTVKHHRKLAIVDDRILWEGSLNILSQNDSCELMRRPESSQLVKQMELFIKRSKAR